MIDLSSLEHFTYSSFMRTLRQNASKDEVMDFLKIYNDQFNQACKEKLQKPDIIALQKSIVKFNKSKKIKLPSFVKNAALSELGDPEIVGQYLSDIIRFTIKRIKPESRPKAILKLRSKIYNLNEYELANKKLPASASMGQAITFVKHVLFNHDVTYVRKVLNSITKNLQ